MKYKLLAICLFLSGFSYAQGWKFAVNIDPGIHWAAISDDTGASSSAGARFGVNFGVNAENYFRERYAFYTGISFMSIGFRMNNDSHLPMLLKSNNQIIAPNQEAKIGARYITVPVGLKFKTPEYGMISYYFKAGLFPALRTGGAVTLAGSRYDFAKDLNTITCGTEAGFGAMYATGDDTHITAGLIFRYMFVDAMSSGSIKAMPMSVGLSFGFIF